MTEQLKRGEKIATYITKKIGTVECAIIFSILALISLPSVIASHNPLIIVGWIAQTFLQLVLLPIIMIGQNIQSQKSEKIIDNTFATTQQLFALTQKIEELLISQGKAESQSLEEIQEEIGEIQEEINKYEDETPVDIIET